MLRHEENTPVLIHQHIFKNAGTTLGSILSRELKDGFGSLEFDKGDISDESLLQLLRDKNLRGLTSHTVLGMRNHPDIISVILLRDPFKRQLSAWEFECHVQKKSNLAFEEWINSPERSDIQTRFLSGKGACLDPMELRVRVATSNNIFLGLADDFDETMVALEYFLNARQICFDLSYYEPQNVALAPRDPRIVELQREVYQKSNLDKLDKALLVGLNPHFEMRKRSVPDFQARLDSFRNRCAKSCSKILSQHRRKIDTPTFVQST
jgi:hypothetical protein